MSSESQDQSDHTGIALDVSSTAVCTAGPLLAETDSSLHSLQNDNTLLKTALAFMPLGICVFDKQDRLLLCNQQYLDIWKLPRELGQRGTSFSDIMAASRGQEMELPDQPLPGTAGHRRREFVTEAGARIQVLVHVLDDGTVVALHRDITESHQAQERISFLAMHDTLTGLCNRATLYERLNDSLLPTAVPGTRILLYLDLDAFKQVNDRRGHPAGDELLRQVADRLRNCCRSNDLVARLGGDEFAILMDPAETQDEHGAQALSEKIIASLSRPFIIESHPTRIGVSIGICCSSETCTTAAHLLKNADMALYSAKSKGGNLLEFFHADLDCKERERQAFNADFCQALENEEFELFYQPQLDASSMEICGVEAMIRWNHPVRGLIGLEELMPIAKATGFIIPIEQWALRQACLEASRWPNHVKITINISGIQLPPPMLLDDVDKALASCNLPAHRLELEITEPAMMEDINATQALLHEFKLREISIAIDDFGSGASSLQHLHKFPTNKLKINRSIVSLMDTEPAINPTVRAIVDLANRTGRQVTAKGVETRAQLEIALELGCHLVQGDLIFPPCLATDIQALMRSSRPYRKKHETSRRS
ncbi:putative bifunctional diguanylate cyclase/phosphodiesterase [Granulosicoccus sp. 3-233]|uniref:putative bifunctional diguanylate cyclase/phosphodiesterase n=1 Tax=Granulosicoccus sp. 3-233 TaxID=3417969 RepID=UPI003D35432F